MFGNSKNMSPSWEALELTIMANLFESTTPGFKQMICACWNPLLSSLCKVINLQIYSNNAPGKRRSEDCLELTQGIFSEIKFLGDVTTDCQ